MDEEVIDRNIVEKRLVKKVPFKYQYDEKMTTLSPDSGISKVGAKIDGKTGALMYEYYEEWIRKELEEKKEKEEKNIIFSPESNAFIHFEENESAEFTLAGEIASHRVEGAFRVLNRSLQDRLWDLFIELADTTGTTLSEGSIKIKEIEPGKSFKLDYLVKREDVSLALEELFILAEDYPNPESLPVGDVLPIELHLGVKNITPIIMKNITVEKNIPGRIRNLTTSGGEEEDQEVELNENKLLWNLTRIEPGEIKILKITGEIMLKEKEEVEMGRTVVSASADDKISGVVVKDFGGYCKNMYMVEMTETDIPGSWVCQLTYKNPSDFSVKLERVEVLDAKTRKVYLALEDLQDIVPPKGEWKSETWNVIEDERPAFLKNIQFRVIPSLSKEYSFKLIRRGIILKPAQLIFTKTTDRKEIPSYRSSRVVLTTEVKNTGSARFREIVIREAIPEGAIPPKIDEIKVLKNGEEVPGIKIWLNYNDETREMLLRIGEIPSALRGDEFLSVVFPLIISHPTPDEIYSFTTSVVGLPVERGPPVSGRLEGALPSVNVVLVVKKMAIGKAIEPTKVPEEYKIELFYFNEGNNSLKEVVIRDLMPLGFKLKSANYEPQIKKVVSGEHLLMWRFDEIGPGERLKIYYIIKGEGEYSPSDAQIFYNSQ